MTRVEGLHHVTAIASDPQSNIDFYAGVLGLRLVKRTVNFDDPRTWHLYYGDEVGSPGSLITFFAWPDAPRGRQGPGQVAVTAFAVLPGAFGFWLERFIRYRVPHEAPTRRRVGRETESVIAFRDPDGTLLEIVTHPGAATRPAWADAPGIARDDAIHGLHSATIWMDGAGPLEGLLQESLGFREVATYDGARRFESGDGGVGTYVNVRDIGGFMRGNEGPGTVHHVAFCVPDDATERAVRQQVTLAGLIPTAQVDRKYFHSVYFRHGDTVLCEVATDGPGFTVDEPRDSLGANLALPEWLESRRAEISAALPALRE
jgi:catechol 2,3-dioxygenase-like lactoylglutathione lyase family enzyme